MKQPNMQKRLEMLENISSAFHEDEWETLGEWMFGTNCQVLCMYHHSIKTEMDKLPPKEKLLPWTKKPKKPSRKPRSTKKY